jgi:hypothetical protein
MMKLEKHKTHLTQASRKSSNLDLEKPDPKLGSWVGFAAWVNCEKPDPKLGSWVAFVIRLGPGAKKNVQDVRRAHGPPAAPMHHTWLCHAQSQLASSQQVQRRKRNPNQHKGAPKAPSPQNAKRTAARCRDGDGRWTMDDGGAGGGRSIYTQYAVGGWWVAEEEEQARHRAAAEQPNQGPKPALLLYCPLRL